MSMNKYGTQAMAHWQKWLPQRLATIRDPEHFFMEMGEQISKQVRELSLALAGDDPPGETYENKLGRLNMARLQAEGSVMREIALLEPEKSDTPMLGEPNR